MPEHNHDHNDDHDHDIDEAIEEALELDTQSRIFLEMRKQNLDLLRIAAEVVGFSGNHPPVKQGDLKNVLRTMWDVYSEFYTWVDPEDTEGEDEDEDEDL
jgi:hypothetical protein